MVSPKAKTQISAAYRADVSRNATTGAIGAPVIAVSTIQKPKRANAAATPSRFETEPTTAGPRRS